MSYIPAIVNSTHLLKPDVKYNWNGTKIKGEFQWDLPIEIPALMNNYWGIKMKQATIANKIVSTRKPGEYIMNVYNHSPADPVQADISHEIEFAHSPFEVIQIMNDLIKDKFPVQFTVQNNVATMTVGPDAYIALGHKLTEALGLKYLCKSRDLSTCVFSTGVYKGDCSDFTAIYNGYPDEIYIALDIAKPIMFGNTFKPIIGTITGMQYTDGESEFYHDLIQSPVSSISITFLDQTGRVIDFYPQSSNDFLFSLQFEFKKLVLYD